MILNYNDSDTVKQIVDHIYYYASFDYILIVDNCSSDESWNKILTYVDDRIIAVQTNYNGGMVTEITTVFNMLKKYLNASLCCFPIQMFFLMKI